MTATRQAFTSSGGGTTFAGVYDITQSPYNASTGAADNTAAIQAAINAAKGTGGIVYVPPGVFKYASQLVCDSPFKGFAITGAWGGVGEGPLTPSELRFTGTGSGSAISCHSVFAFGLEHIRFTYSNSGFTGDLIDIDGGPHNADCTNWRITGCSSDWAFAGAQTARSIVRLSQAINGLIEDCGWGGAVNILRLGDPNGNYVVGVKITNCTFNAATDAMILVGTSDGENVAIDNNRFEAGTNTTAIRGTSVAADGGNNGLYSPMIEANWFGDASLNTTWVKELNTIGQYTGVVRNNRFATVAAGGTHLTLNGKWLVMSNSFETGTALSSTFPTGTNFASIANNFNCDRIFPASWNFANAEPNSFMSLHDTGVGGAQLGVNQLNAVIGLRTHTNTLDTSGPEDLLLGSSGAGGFIAMPAQKSAIYAAPGPGGGYLGPVLTLQAPDGGGADFGHLILVGLAAGTLTPTRMLHIQQGARMGFFGATPIVQPARTGQLTDSTGGTVTSTLAAGITDAVAKNAIASLAAKVNALETIIHNLGLSA